jgi:DNA-binding NtrC family response regulator
LLNSSVSGDEVFIDIFTGGYMQPRILVVNADQNETDSIGNTLRRAGFSPCVIVNLEGVEDAIASNNCVAVLLDLDSIAVSNRTVRRLTLQFPRVCFLCTSGSPFHPGLEDAIGLYFYACIQKPIDPDELLYWLKCIHSNMEEKA